MTEYAWLLQLSQRATLQKALKGRAEVVVEQLWHVKVVLVVGPGVACRAASWVLTGLSLVVMATRAEAVRNCLILIVW